MGVERRRRMQTKQPASYENNHSKEVKVEVINKSEQPPGLASDAKPSVVFLCDVRRSGTVFRVVLPDAFQVGDELKHLDDLTLRNVLEIVLGKGRAEEFQGGAFLIREPSDPKRVIEEYDMLRDKKGTFRAPKKCVNEKPWTDSVSWRECKAEKSCWLVLFL